MSVHKDSITDLTLSDLLDLGGIIFLSGVHCFIKALFVVALSISLPFVLILNEKMVCTIKKG